MPLGGARSTGVVQRIVSRGSEATAETAVCCEYPAYIIHAAGPGTARTTRPPTSSTAASESARARGFLCGLSEVMTTSSRCWRQWQLTCISTMRAENSMNPEPRECGLSAQVSRCRIYPEERPARKPGVDAPFKPRHRLVRVPEHCIDAGNVEVGVMRVAERTRGVQRLTNLALSERVR